MSRRILVKVSPTGEIEIVAEGFQGKQCTEATKALEDALGLRTSRKLRPEFQRQKVSRNQNQTIGHQGGEG